jgi:ABC-type proline/glycine betaine transport system permease subunit
MIALRHFMNGLLQDVRVSARSLQKKPGFALLAILILALGSGATTVIFTLISSVLLKAVGVSRASETGYAPRSNRQARGPMGFFLP